MIAALLAALLSATTHGVANARLVEAAKTAPLTAVDYDNDRCDPRTVEQWLTDLTAKDARAITWTGGPCRLVGFGIDSGSRWCAQATVTLAQPQSKTDRPIIEIFFEQPTKGVPGKPYAFRAAMLASDGDDTMRFRNEFESVWLSRFPGAADAIVDCPAEDAQ
jgi:hypothetical protein